MASYRNLSCGPCESRHNTNMAVIWCPNCEEGLCTECSNYHHVFKSTRQHKTISVESFNHLPSFVQNSSQLCEDHDDILGLYCVVHQTPCCIECITAEHSECPGVTSLKKVVTSVSESAFFQSVDSSIKEMITFLEKIKENRDVNLNRLQEQGKSLHDRVKAMRLKVNMHLDKLEEVLNQSIDFEINSETSRIKEVREEIDRMLAKAHEKRDDISKIIDFATELQVFFAIRYLEKEIAVDTKQITRLLEISGIEDSNINLQISEDIERTVPSINSMGLVTISRTPLSLYFGETNLKSQFAQISRCEYTIQHIVLKHVKTSAIPDSENIVNEINICSSVILPDGRIVICNNNNSDVYGGQLFVFGAEGNFQKTIPCKSSPFGMTLISNEEMAVSFHRQKSVFTFRLMDFTFNRTILANYSNFGISCFEQNIIVSIREIGIAFFNSSGKVFKVLPVDYATINYVNLQKDRIYYTVFNDDTLYCIDTDGKDIWICRFEKMKGPRNVCTDSAGNIFVAACDSNNVIVISPDGKDCKEILGPDDGIKEPKAICFDSRNSYLLVASKTGTVFKYRLTYI